MLLSIFNVCFTMILSMNLLQCSPEKIIFIISIIIFLLDQLIAIKIIVHSINFLLQRKARLLSKKTDGKFIFFSISFEYDSDVFVLNEFFQKINSIFHPVCNKGKGGQINCLVSVLCKSCLLNNFS